MRFWILAATILCGSPALGAAEDHCIQEGGKTILLTNHGSCRAGLAAFDREADWKYAILDPDEEEPAVGCWRDDGIFVRIEVEGQTLRKKPSEILTGEACEPKAERITAVEWEEAIGVCESLDTSPKDSVAFCERAMSLAQSFSKSDPRYLRTLQGLGWRVAATDPGRGEALYQEALSIARQNPSGTAKEVMNALFGIGIIRQKLPDWESSIPYHEQAITVGRQQFGPTNLQTIVHMLLLGKLYLDHGRTHEAKKWLSASLEAATTKQTEHWLMASNLASNSARFLADAYQAEGDLAETERFREIQRRYKTSPKNLERESSALIELDDAG